MLFDSHSHISDEMYENKDALIEEIKASSLKYVMDIGTNVSTSRGCIRMAEANDFCYAAVGIHPEFADEANEESLAEIESMAAHPKVKAIGEIGLDYHYDDGLPKDIQEYCFASQIELAKKLGMPIVIHSREADEDMMRILKEHKAFETKVLMHCFSSSAETARQYLKLGAMISIAGPITYKNARKGIEVVETVPLDRLLIETDCPYLTPVPFRGQINKPPYVEYTARKIGEIKGISFEEVAEVTLRNASEFFGVKDN